MVKEVLVANDDEFDDQERGHITFSGRFFRRAMLKVRAKGLLGFLTVHTHPGSENSVAFSSYDNANDPSLMQNLGDQQPTGKFGNIVAGKNVFQGRIWDVEPKAFPR